ncbi:MAG: response regulator [Blastocatellia bacterium]|nr:response regulator [Blastocatellia bacterium]
MEPIRTLIVDDEPIAREGVRMQLERAAGFEIIGECGNGLEAVRAIEQQAPDLVFLDVQMPELSGFDVVERVGTDRMPAVVFVTAYDQYALHAFDAHAVDYLLKPVNGDRFDQALQRARAQLQGGRIENIDRRLTALIEEIKERPKYLERIAIKSSGSIFFLEVEQLDWIEAASNYVRLHAGALSHMLHETMNSLESRLDPERFARIHRSAIVHVSRIKEMHMLFHGEYEVVLKNGTRLKSGRGYRDRLRSLLGNSR